MTRAAPPYRTPDTLFTSGHHFCSQPLSVATADLFKAGATMAHVERSNQHACGEVSRRGRELIPASPEHMNRGNT